MQIAVVFTKSVGRRFAVLDTFGDRPRLFVLNRVHQLAILIVLAVASLALWRALSVYATPQYPAAEPLFLHRTHVAALTPDVKIRAGDMIVLRRAGPITPLKVVNSPGQVVKEARPGSADAIFILGPNRYYVIAENGTGQVVRRDQIVGLMSGPVQN